MHKSQNWYCLRQKSGNADFVHKYGTEPCGRRTAPYFFLRNCFIRKREGNRVGAVRDSCYVASYFAE